jgi:hypothetical protein
MCSAEEMIRSAQIGAIPDGNYWMASGGYALVGPAATPRDGWNCAGWTYGGDASAGGAWGAGMDACGTVGIYQSCPSWFDCDFSGSDRVLRLIKAI